MRISNAQPKQGLDKALRLVDKLATSGTAMTISEICEYLSITKSTAYSMLQSFLSRDFIERDPETGKYSIGFRFYEYGMGYRYKYSFLPVAGKQMQVYAEKMNIRCSVSVLKNIDTIIQLLTIDRSTVPEMPWGFVYPSFASAGGKVLMAHADREEVLKWLETARLTRFTPKTITDKKKFIVQLDEILANGYALDHAELISSRSCVSAPIFDVSGKVIAAISFQTNEDDLLERETELIENLMMLTAAISGELGYSVLRK